MPRMTLELDQLDFDTIQNEITVRQLRRDNDGLLTLPDGESDLAGAVIAEAIRDLDDYRALYNVEHPRKGTR